MTTKTITARFFLEKETKGTFKYEERDEHGREPMSPISGTFYLRKAAIAAAGLKEAPKAFTLSLNVEA